MSGERPSQWPLLFDLANDILKQFRARNGFTPEWSFGGGTALMLQIDHRDSHDIDIFLGDPQLLPFLNPETQGYAMAVQPGGYVTDGAHALKLVYDDVGEIDFICGTNILDAPFERREVRGRIVALETPAEIIAKKIFYRGGSLQPRDMFDLAAVAARFGDAYVANALRQCGRDRCRIALDMVEKAKPAFVRSVMRQLAIREGMEHLLMTAQDTSRRILELALAEGGPSRS